MAGPLDIQRLPFGLVDLLGMKGSGATPYALAEAIAVTLADGADYYLAPRRVTLTGDSAVAMTGSGFFAAVGIVVPSSECWLVYNVTATLNAATAAATALKFAGAVQKVNSGSAGAVQLTEMVNLGAADLGSAHRQFERPMICLPGDQFGCQSYTSTGVPGANGRIRLDVARLSL